jgi:phage shock protein C
MNGKRLTKSRDNRMICGVCGGIAEYFGVDPTIIRLLLAVFCLAGGSGILAYIIAAIVMPEA